MKYLKFFLICLFSFSLNAKTLELPKVTAEYVCNTKFIIGVAILETRTFQGNNKKRVWPKTYSYLSVPLNKESQTNLKKAANITELEKISNDYLRGFEVDLYKLKLNLPDGTTEESTRWITKNGVTLKEVGFITGDEGKIHFYSEFSNVKMFKQDERLFEVPEGFKLAPVEDLDDVNELLKTMVKRG